MKKGITSLDLIRSIILGYTGLDDNRVIIYNQKIKIPSDEDVWVSVNYGGSKIFSSRSSFTPDGNFNEVCDLSVMESLSLNVLSRGLGALQTKELFVMALNSYLSQSVQEQNSFKILRIAPINDLSELEGSAQLYRFEIPMKVLAWYQNITPADYYDYFRFQVLENGDPEILTPVIEQPVIEPIL